MSIVGNAPAKFEGRKIGAFVTDGVDADVIKDLREAAASEGAMVEVVAPTIVGVRAGDGSMITAQQKIDGGPSVLFDAIAILPARLRPNN